MNNTNNNSHTDSDVAAAPGHSAALGHSDAHSHADSASHSHSDVHSQFDSRDDRSDSLLEATDSDNNNEYDYYYSNKMNHSLTAASDSVSTSDSDDNSAHGGANEAGYDENSHPYSAKGHMSKKGSNASKIAMGSATSV